MVVLTFLWPREVGSVKGGELRPTSSEAIFFSMSALDKLRMSLLASLTV